ncbi:MAG: HlyD family efflux transporter periplasmic adaptor subunit [Pseudomonadota bacterium]
MNAPLPKKDPEAHQTRPTQAGRDLNSAIVACFSLENVTPPFPERLIELAVALTSQRNVTLWTRSKPDAEIEVTAAHKSADPDAVPGDAPLQILDGAANVTAPVIQVVEGFLAASVAMPEGRVAVLMLEMPNSGSVARALVYERVTLLANLSYAQFRHGDMTSQSGLIRALSAVAPGKHEELQALTDHLAQVTGSDYAAAGLYKSGTVRDVTISGQKGITKRAQLPVKLRDTMTEIGRKRIVTNERMFAAAPEHADGLALIIEGPTRNHGMLRIAGAVYAQAQHSKPKSRWTAARLVKICAILLAIGGIGLIPIADGVDISATVESAKTRVVTAPLSSTIADVLVSDKEAVIAGETVLARLDTNEIDIERIGVVAERANAVLERETARAQRDAAVLRNSELEVQRLDARIALLDLQRESSEIIAPISGIAVLSDLEQRLGASVRQGETLLEISDPSELRLSLAVLESQISKIAEADNGIFRPDFDPSLRLDATISRLSPAVDNTEDVPLILGKASFDQPAAALRPGLRGIFAVDQQYRPIWQVLYRSIRNWVLLRVWI